MKTRLLRDFRDLAPFWIFAIAAPAIGYLWPWPAESNPRLANIMGDRFWFTGLVVYFSFHALGVLAFSREFDHRTMEFLLSQPVERRTLWRERMGLLLVLLLTASVADMITYSRQWVEVWKWIEKTWTPGREIYMGKADVPIFYWLTGVSGSPRFSPPGIQFEPRYWTLPYMDWVFGCSLIGAVSGFCFGPLTALYLRKSMTAFCAAAILPVAMFLGVILMADNLSNVWSIMPDGAASQLPEEVTKFLSRNPGAFLYAVLILYVIAIPGLGYVLARRKFMRLEIL